VLLGPLSTLMADLDRPIVNAGPLVRGSKLPTLPSTMDESEGVLDETPNTFCGESSLLSKLKTS